MNTPAPLFQHLAIIGVGLIGGSVAMAARESGIAARITGTGRSHNNLEQALKLGVIDAALPLEQAATEADAIVLAIPVGQMPHAMATLAAHMAPHAVLADAGSTKGDVVAAARTHLAHRLPRFVPSHPIAGAEKSGVAAARPDLFHSKHVVLTPLPETDADATARVEALWQGCGAIIRHMAVDTHDQVFAAVSHLPHVLAFALVEEIACRPDAEQLLGYAAGGFRDFSRIAGSSPEMWRDICLANRAAILRELEAYQARLDSIRAMIDRQDEAALAQVFGHASAARNAWANLRHKP